MLRSWQSQFRIIAGEQKVFRLNSVLGFFRKANLDCLEVRKLSSEYLEGDLPPSRLQIFRDHISNCRFCQSFIDSLASVVNMLSTLPKTQSPPTLKQSIIKIVKEQGHREVSG